MKFKNIDDENFLIYAIKHYDNPSCKGINEFYEDVSRIVYLKRLFKKYKNTGDLKERLILNHIITLYNVFGIEGSTRILFSKIDSEFHSALKTFLIYLEYIKPDRDYLEWELKLTSIPLDTKIVDKLRNI